MSDLQRYIQNRKIEDAAFAEDFDEGYKSFKIGVLLRQLREETGMTQTEIAEKLHTNKSAISRIENHSEDVKLSTLEKFASALGRRLEVRIA
jgi:HTH-type transcriptional regulator/antitoxin HipB